MKRIQIHDEFNLSDQDLEKVVGGLDIMPLDYNICMYCNTCINCNTCTGCETCTMCQSQCTVCASITMV